MFFKKKKEKLICSECGSGIKSDFTFCPYCGLDLYNPEEDMRDFGMLGKEDSDQNEMEEQLVSNLGLTDKILGSLINNLMKNIDQQFRNYEKTEIRTLPNGIKINIGVPRSIKPQQVKQKLPDKVTDEQIKKMGSLPRVTAKTDIKRLNDKLIYELNTPGLSSINDVIVSKLESGYEIKAIADKKIYVNSLPVNLPLNGFSISDNKLLVEFRAL